MHGIQSILSQTMRLTGKNWVKAPLISSLSEWGQCCMMQVVTCAGMSSIIAA